MSGGNGDAFSNYASDLAWWDDIVLRILPPSDAVRLTRNDLDVIRAHVRHEVVHSPEVHEILQAKIHEVLKDLKSNGS